MTPDDRSRSEEGRRAIERAERDAEGLFAGSMKRAARHFAAAEVDPSDKVELWGRRIGRALSLVAVIVLAFLLFEKMTAR